MTTLGCCLVSYVVNKVDSADNKISGKEL